MTTKVTTMTTATTTRRYIDQFNEEISAEDAIALMTGEALPMWKESAYNWEALDEDGILYSSYEQADVETWEAAVEEYTLTVNTLGEFYDEFLAEAIAELEDDLEENELASLTDEDLAEMVTEDASEALQEWLDGFHAEALKAYAWFSCPVDAMDCLSVSI